MKLTQSSLSSSLRSGMLFTAALAALLSLPSCSEAPINKDDPAVLYKEAEQEISNDHYMMAIDKLREVKNKFPYSKYAVDAQLRLGDVYFLQESFAEAAAVYESFRDLHPRHERVPHALFRAGKSHFRETPEEVTRDLGPAERSLQAYQEFISRFPADANAAEARADMAALKERLAEKERRTAEFYFKRGHLRASRSRFEQVLAKYPETLAAKQSKARIESLTASGAAAGETK